MSLLSANDFDTLKNAMLRDEEICLERELRGLRVTAKTCRVKHPWPVLMAVQIQVTKGQYFWIQTFETIEEAKKGLMNGG